MTVTWLPARANWNANVLPILPQPRTAMRKDFDESGGEGMNKSPISVENKSTATAYAGKVVTLW
ncbi:hypothetical protein Rhsp01_42670 [Rhizobium sp. NBRC 114257]|uniref:Uncharacterized protein n=1 Tax=Rhizobium dioscoreae TaxID=2653122 RepID=A0ABQ0Z9G7_9HYPH|nr:hypothetical protein RsS93_48040 [Rhizobium dioscoreae]GLU83091.1 hypothetical protein Rhsp01_42670 [Rhizobium sp. NBRC 114257]